MTRHFQFFNENIKENLKTDTLKKIGPYWIYPVYPDIIVETKRPYEHSTTTNAKIEGLHIKPDSYSLFKFMQEHPEFYKPIIESSPYLNFLYQDWNLHKIPPENLTRT